MKKLLVKKVAEINEDDIYHHDTYGEIHESEYKDLLRDIKYYIETDQKINNRFWKYVVDYAIKQVVEGKD